MSYRWPRDPQGKPIPPKDLSSADKAKYLEVVESAIRDGGPSPGADYLQFLCNTFQLGASEIVKALSVKTEPKPAAVVAAAPVVAPSSTGAVPTP